MTFRICDAHPGPGYWQRDNSHFPVPISRHFWELFMPPYEEGTRRAFARYGCVLDHFDISLVKGRVFSRTHFVNEPEELQKRSQVAEQALATKIWRQDQAAWPGLRDSFRSRLLELARRDPSTLDSKALHKHLVALRKIFNEGAIQHFIQQPASMIPVAA